MKYIRVLISSVFFLVCCKGSVKESYPEISTQLSFPETLELKLNDYSLPFGGLDSKYKILISYDSLMCGTCSVKRLTMWNDVLKYAEDHSDSLSVVFLFSPKESEKESVSVLLDTDPVSYPAFLDVNNDFYRLNSLPKGIFSCLLDNDNNVLLVGHASNDELLNDYNKVLNFD